MPPYASDGRIVALDTEDEVQVDEEGDMFIVRYEVNRVTVIEDPKSRVEGLYATVRHINRADGTVRNDGQNDWNVGKWKKVMEALTLYKQKKDKILLANQPHMGGLKPEGDEDWKIKLFSNIPRGTRLTAERMDGLKIGRVPKALEGEAT